MKKLPVAICQVNTCLFDPKGRLAKYSKFSQFPKNITVSLFIPSGSIHDIALIFDP